MAEPQDPQTPADWQLAVDAAAFWLLVDDARLYGLVTITGPTVDRDRCRDILARGACRGIRPHDDAADFVRLVKYGRP
jgi:hypothetical protein